MPDPDVLLFFNEHAAALPLYEALEALLLREFPGTKKRVQKTQITFFRRHVFACVSFARVKRKAELPPVWLTLTLGLSAPLESGRVAVKTEPYPGRWTHHLVLSSPEELDAELLGWLRASFAFSEEK